LLVLLELKVKLVWVGEGCEGASDLLQRCVAQT
jgi:hypothetical protein